MKLRRKSGMKDGQVKINLFVAKAYEDEAGEWWLDAIASGVRKDLQGDRITTECIASMAQQINAGQIPFCTTHYDTDILDEFGYVKSGTVDPSDQLLIRVWLDKTMTQSQVLWRKLNGVPEKGIQPSKLGVSIGGWVVNGQSETVNGEYGYAINDLKLEHVVPTSRPAYPDARITGFEAKAREFAQDWMGSILKSISPGMRSGRQPSVETDQGGDPVKLTKTEGQEAERAEAAVTPGDEQAEKAGSCVDGCTCCSDCSCCATECCAGACTKCHAAGKSADGSEDGEEGGDGGDSGGSDHPCAKGKWLKAGDLTGDEMVLCLPVADPNEEAGKSEKTEEGEDVNLKEMQEKIAAQETELAALKAKLEVGAEDPEKLEKTNDGAPPEEPAVRKGQATAGGEADQKRTESGPNYIERLKATPEYQKAPAHERLQMIDKAFDEEAKKVTSGR